MDGRSVDVSMEYSLEGRARASDVARVWVNRWKSEEPRAWPQVVATFLLVNGRRITIFKGALLESKDAEVALQLAFVFGNSNSNVLSQNSQR